MLLQYSGNKGPLCPNQLDPMHPMHRFHVNLQDAAYKASSVDTETLEFTEPGAEKVYSAISYEQYDGYMRAYRDVSTVLLRGRPEGIETYYFRCSICGLILPANKV